MKLYTIGEIAQLTGIPVKTIRYYDEIQLVTPREKSEAGYRLYSLAEAQTLQYIMTFRLMGFPIQEIRHILTGRIDVEQAAVLQLQALKKQIQSLHHIEVLLEKAISHHLLQSLEFITQIGEELKMTEQQRKDALVEQFRQVMLRDCCSPEWVEEVFSKHEHMLRNLTLDTKEKIDAFHELQTLLTDPEFIKEAKNSMGHFWDMVKNHSISPTQWENAMEKLFEKAKKAVKDNLEATSPEVQHLVDEWMTIISENINIPISPRFMAIFKERVDGMYGSERQQRYWRTLRALDAKADVHEAMLLLRQGLEYRMQQEGNME